MKTKDTTIPSPSAIPVPSQAVVDWYGSLSRAMETAALPPSLLREEYDRLRTPTWREFSAEKAAALEWVIATMRLRRIVEW